MFRFCCSLLTLCLLSGCAMTVERHLDSVRNDFLGSNEIDKDFSNKNNLDLLFTADSLFHTMDYSSADAAYEEFNKRNTDVTRASFSREATSVLFGANVNEYRPYMMDMLFVSYYQLWMALAESRYDDARVIINQSYARQQDMSRAYAKTTENNKQELLKHSELNRALESDNTTWTAYRDIMNPALMYLSGIYFLNNGEFSDAETYLKRASGMMPNNSFIASDLKYAEKELVPNNTVWVFIEDGFAPKLIEKRVSLPIVSGDVKSMVTVATSEPKFFNSTIKIDATQDLASVDAMFMTEYNEYRINDTARALTSAVARMALQSSVYNSKNSVAPILGLLSTAYSEITTNADIRTWVTLPKNISVMRMKKNKSGLIDLTSNGNLVSQVSVPNDGNNYLVYVRVGKNKYDTKVIKLKK